MNKVKIYQIKDIAKTPYAFREYNKEQFSLDDYELVMEEDYRVTENTKEDLEYIFQMGNNPEFTKKYGIRSVSVSDVIELDGKKYYVNNFGYKELGE